MVRQLEDIADTIVRINLLRLREPMGRNLTAIGIHTNHIHSDNFIRNSQHNCDINKILITKMQPMSKILCYTYISF